MCSSDLGVPAGAQIPLVVIGADDALRARATRWSDTLLRLARLSEIRFEATAPKNAVQLLVRGSVAALPLEGIVDLGAEVSRLRKEAVKAAGEIEKIDAKLANADFMARAPDEIVDEQHERRAAQAARLEKITEALTRLTDEAA